MFGLFLYFNTKSFVGVLKLIRKFLNLFFYFNTKSFALEYTLPSYEKLKLQQIVANDLNSVANDDLSEISSEIEDGLKA